MSLLHVPVPIKFYLSTQWFIIMYSLALSCRPTGLCFVLKVLYSRASGHLFHAIL